MPIVSESVLAAKADIEHLAPEIEAWTNDFLALVGNVTNLDLVFQEAGDMDLNYVALCEWDDPSRLVAIRTVQPKQTPEDRRKTLAATSVLAASLGRLKHFEVGVALLGETEGKIFRHEGLAGHCRNIRGCSRGPSILDFSSIPGHVLRSSAAR